MFEGPPAVKARSKRVFLFLQGPSSPYFQMLADELAGRGHEVRRINICFGDRFFWRRQEVENYRGRLEDWPAYVAEFFAREQVTDLILLGDRRPHHAAALDQARIRGINCFVTELGYIRPDWITLERDGMTSYSRFPTDPDTIREIAKNVPAPDLETRYRSSFFKMAFWDLQYNLSNVFLGWLYPHYRWHAIYHPLVEYGGWLVRLAKSPLTKRRTKRKLDTFYRIGEPFYLFPLQLQTDYQLRQHSPFSDQQTAISEVISSFAHHADGKTRLLIKLHPWDNGVVNWRRIVRKTARQYGVDDRVMFVDGGNLNAMIKHSQGVVTINSTVGTAALGFTKPVITLGTAIYDISGLTHQAGLDLFWRSPQAPDAQFWNDFVRVLAATIQVKGGLYAAEGLKAAVKGSAERLISNSVNEPNAYVDPPPRTVSRPAATGALAAAEWGALASNEKR